MQVLAFMDKYHLRLGNWVSLFWCTYVSLRTYLSAESKIHIVFSFSLVYISMMLTWLMVFRFLRPLEQGERFYKLVDVFRVFFYIFMLILPLIFGYYWGEIAYTQALETFNKEEFFSLYIVRMVFQFGLVMTFKYLIDSREVAKKNLDQAQQLKQANIKAQFEILKQQVNPHFLFNALSTLKSLIRLEDPQSEQFVMSLSDVYRKLLQERDKELIRLSDEMEIVNAYLFMQKLRFENNLMVENTIPTNKEGLFIPPFALQLLVENTIKHNIISQRKPLILRIFCTPDDKIVVENTKQPKKTNEESTGWGLSSLMERYAAFTMIPIDIQQTETLFSVTLPLITEG